MAAHDIASRGPLSNLITDSQRAGASVGLTFDRITIEGGSPLSGEVDVRGAKNLVTKAMVAALLSEGVSVLRDVPDISDVRVVRGLLEIHGVTVTDGAEPGELLLDAGNVRQAHMREIDAHDGSSRIPIPVCCP